MVTLPSPGGQVFTNIKHTHGLRHGFLVELWVIAHHALSIFDHSGKHGCQSVMFILVKAGKFSKAKDTTMLSIAIFVDVRLRETVVINTPALSHLISDK